MFITDAVIVLVFLYGVFFLLNNVKFTGFIKSVFPSLQRVSEKKNNDSMTHIINNNLSQQMYLDNQKSLIAIVRDKALHYASYRIEFEGKLLFLDMQGGKDKYFRPYKLHIIVGVGEKSEKIPLFFPEEEIAYIKIVDSKNNQLAITDLKKDDRIVVRIISSALYKYPKGLQEAVITRL